MGVPGRAGRGGVQPDVAAETRARLRRCVRRRANEVVERRAAAAAPGAAGEPKPEPSLVWLPVVLDPRNIRSVDFWTGIE